VQVVFTFISIGLLKLPKIRKNSISGPTAGHFILHSIFNVDELHDCTALTHYAA